MPMDRSLYPPNWRQIAMEKKQSVNWICESCGKQCRKQGEPFDTHRRTLTVAHLDHDPSNCSPENLMAMCAVCHLRYDAKHHAESRAKKRRNDLSTN